jgi:hypothetical protein
MFADDIVLFSESAEGLQNSLNCLESYCSKWGLTVNTSKTKVVIFNKGGLKYKKFSFYYENNSIEICQSYTYLGICFSACGTFTKAIKEIVSKASKVFYRLRQLDIRKNALLTIKLFDSLVTPVLSYGSEIWGPYVLKNVTDTNFMQSIDNCHIEKLNIKLCKYILGVNKYATNAAVKGELGRFPILIQVLTLSIKYWMRTCLLQNSEIVKISYLDSLCTDATNSWPGKIYNILELTDSTSIWESQGDLNGNFYCQTLKNKMQEIYKTNWLNHINRNNSNKLRTYAKFKKDFNFEKYILINDFKKRQSFTKFRTSAHNLAIETGRYTRPVTEEENRLCIICNNGSIEDECHLIYECILYANERHEISTQFEEFSSFNPCINTTENFELFMNCNYGDTEFINIICKFIHCCFESRRTILQRHNASHYSVHKDQISTVEFLRLSKICTDLYC